MDPSRWEPVWSPCPPWFAAEDFVAAGGEKLVQVSDLRIQTARIDPTVPPPMEVISFEMRVTGFQLLSFDPDHAPPEATGAEVES